MPFKSEKQRKWMWANDPEMAKKWEKEEKMKKETKVRQLIKKMVREELTEGSLNEWKKNFPGFSSKEYEIIQNWIDMGSLSQTIAMYRKNKKTFSQFVKDSAKEGMIEGYSIPNNIINDQFNELLLFIFTGIFFILSLDYIYKFGKKSF